MRALFFFFKKKIYEYEKKWKEEVGSKELAVDERRETRDESDAGSKELSVDDDERRDASQAENENSDVILSEAKDPVKSSASCENAKQEAESKTPDAESVTQDAPPVEAVAKKPAETPKTEHLKASEDQPDVILSETKEPVKSSADSESAQPAEVKSSPVVEVSSDAKVVESAKPDDEKNAEDKKPKKEKRKLSDREFWTIILTPDFDARAFKYILKILKAVLTLFRVRFSDCFVEGIRTDYQTMGYIAAVNGFLKAYPYVGDWDLRMDWMNEKELRAEGSVHLSITLLRIFCFTLETLVLAGILALSFWRRRAHVIKTNELPQLGFIRRRILEFILED
ncbi:hypothetical protein [Fibrobacter sp.]|uniref:hypothetical protein n=1 Tax=Fibrobacter sp. TaxID=35828 RepID=UPI003863B751